MFTIISILKILNLSTKHCMDKSLNMHMSIVFNKHGKQSGSFNGLKLKVHVTVPCLVDAQRGRA